MKLEYLVYNSISAKMPAFTDADIKSMMLISEAQWNEMSRGDETPYFKVESIDFPAKGTGGIYDIDFAKTFIENMKNRPYPGSKRGHEWESRPSTDFYTVGGKVEDNGKDKATMYLVMYIPKDGDTTSNAGFIRDAKLGIVNFSLVTRPTISIVPDANGNTEVHFVSSNGMERNDAVEYGAGAMEQKVNKSDNDIFSNAKELIQKGNFKREGNSAGEIIQDGFVMRPVLRAMLSHADVENKSELSELISMIDKSKNGGRKNMDEEITVVKNGLANGVLNINDLAKTLGIANKMRSDEDMQNADVVANLTKQFNCKAGELSDRLSSLEKSIAVANKAAAENAVIKAFGDPVVKNNNNENVENLAYTRAMELCGNKAGDELIQAVENARKDKYVLAFTSKMADTTADSNVTTVPVTTNKYTENGFVKNGCFEV